MKCSNRSTRFAISLLLGICVADLHAAEEQSFPTPQAAVKALQAAVTAKDQSALSALFGPKLHELLTGDAVQDAANARRFAAVLAEGFRLVKDGKDTMTLEVGPNDWPMPIPLVKADGQWHFDTAAGKEEIINRHIGKDELQAIGVCRAYVTAQRQYAKTNPDEAYAQRFKSTPGKKDGLYWPAAKNEPASPFGPLVAEAQAQGYDQKTGSGCRPFHGYYFRILTEQGSAAPGGKIDYLNHSKLTGGFALVAYPEQWDKSGIMTFIVNQDGKVFQRNLGEETSARAAAIKAYNPDDAWTPVEDEGVLRAASER